MAKLHTVWTNCLDPPPPAIFFTSQYFNKETLEPFSTIKNHRTIISPNAKVTRPLRWKLRRGFQTNYPPCTSMRNKELTHASSEKLHATVDVLTNVGGFLYWVVIISDLSHRSRFTVLKRGLHGRAAQISIITK